MDDILTRLRTMQQDAPFWRDLFSEAADEIERLRKALSVYTEVVDNINRVAGHIPEVKAEVERG